MTGGRRLAALAVFLIATLSACTPGLVIPGPAIGEPHFTETTFIAADGTELPLRSWRPTEGKSKAVVVALHGFNDYGNFFAKTGTYLATRGVTAYAYDQRGFGAAPAPGSWAGVAAYVRDAADAVDAAQRRHPGLPVYLHGTSMGGAVAIMAMTNAEPASAVGVILAAPAVWGRVTMPWYQRLSLWVSAHLVPWFTVSGEGLGIKPSDNKPMLIRLGRDPKVIKHTRVGTIYGLVNLMDAALENVAKLTTPALILYGEKDEIIPKTPTRIMLGRLPKSATGRPRVALYANGYHMLLRDLQGAVVWKDMAAWMLDRRAPLPSNADRHPLRALGMSR